MTQKKLIPCLYLRNGKAVTGFNETALIENGDACSIVKIYGESGADALIAFDCSTTDDEHEQTIGIIREICLAAEIPVFGGGNIRRMEDIKKLLYAGCAKTVLDFTKESNVTLLEEVSERFGKEKMVVSVSAATQIEKNIDRIEAYAGTILSMDGPIESIAALTKIPVILHTSVMTQEAVADVLRPDTVEGITGGCVNDPKKSLMQLKQYCQSQGLTMSTLESAIAWSAFTCNSDGLVPVIVQDYKTDEVLMLGYMNETSFNMTLTSGKMTYWSRSRQELWEKGDTSGHYQYVKSLTLDCDNDTLLAKVSQIGAACHTGNRTCFFKELFKKEYDDTNPLHVFQDVYDVIMDRKVHPKDGSYTNYLFDKGIDKILKKVGEECTEIVIAAKNPDKEEIKYEISDFLYHVMVLMAERGVTWDEITRELARR